MSKDLSDVFYDDHFPLYQEMAKKDGKEIFDCTIEKETEKSYLVFCESYGSGWIPKKLAEILFYEALNLEKPWAVIMIPSWLFKSQMLGERPIKTKSLSEYPKAMFPTDKIQSEGLILVFSKEDEEKAKAKGYTLDSALNSK